MRLTLSFLACAGFVSAGVIIDQPPVDGSAVSVNSSQWLAQSFTLGQTYTNLTMTAWFFSVADNQPYHMTAYLTSSLGFGTTAPALATTSITGATLFGQPKHETLFSGLTLAAGTYYVTLTSPDASPNGAAWLVFTRIGVGDPNAGTLAPGAATGELMDCRAGCSSAFPPDAFFLSSPDYRGAWRLTGDAAVPEPATGGLLALAVVALAWRRRAC